jgi:hypothetical protein
MLCAFISHACSIHLILLDVIHLTTIQGKFRKGNLFYLFYKRYTRKSALSSFYVNPWLPHTFVTSVYKLLVSSAKNAFGCTRSHVCTTSLTT